MIKIAITKGRIEKQVCKLLSEAGLIWNLFLIKIENY